MIKTLFVLAFLGSQGFSAEPPRDPLLSVPQLGALRASVGYFLDATIARAATGVQLRKGTLPQPPRYKKTPFNKIRDHGAGVVPRFLKSFLENQFAARVLSSETTFEHPFVTTAALGVWQWSSTPSDVLATRKIMSIEQWRAGKISHPPSYLSIARELGLRSLYRGAMVGTASSALSWLAFMNYTKTFVLPKIENNQYGILPWIFTSLGATIVEFTTYTPLWNIRTMMVQYPEKTMWDLVKQRAYTQGIKGFFYGGKISSIYALIFSFLDYTALQMQHRKS